MRRLAPETAHPHIRIFQAKPSSTWAVACACSLVKYTSSREEALELARAHATAVGVVPDRIEML
jgi:hypothetical protein